MGGVSRAGLHGEKVVEDIVAEIPSIFRVSSYKNAWPSQRKKYMQALDIPAQYSSNVHCTPVGLIKGAAGYEPQMCGGQDVMSIRVPCEQNEAVHEPPRLSLFVYFCPGLEDTMKKLNFAHASRSWTS